MLPGYFVNNVKIIRNTSPNSTNQDFDWTREFRSRQNGKIPYRRADTERKVAVKPPKNTDLTKKRREVTSRFDPCIFKKISREEAFAVK